MPEIDSGREKPRRRTVLKGKLFDDGDRFSDCTILDLSRSGARIRTREDFAGADNLLLKIDRFNELRRAEVMWRRKNEIGLRFLDEMKTTPRRMAKILESL